MRAIGKRQANPTKRLAPGAVILLLAVVLGLCAAPAAAWLFFGRGVAGVTKIDAPKDIFISAGNKEDVTYLDMSGINVENALGYQDFVFSVRGENISYYNLQLAYTTNNQFSYTLYRAVEGTSGDFLVEYTPHDGSAQKYYKIDSAHSSPIPGTFLNKASGDAVLANDAMHSHTYASEADRTVSYDNVNRYAEPIYWQTSTKLAALHSDGSANLFCDYFIIRVSWAAGKHNDRESDIIYIAAAMTS